MQAPLTEHCNYALKQRREKRENVHYIKAQQTQNKGIKTWYNEGERKLLRNMKRELYWRVPKTNLESMTHPFFFWRTWIRRGRIEARMNKKGKKRRREWNKLRMILPILLLREVTLQNALKAKVQHLSNQTIIYKCGFMSHLYSWYVLPLRHLQNVVLWKGLFANVCFN